MCISLNSNLLVCVCFCAVWFVGRVWGQHCETSALSEGNTRSVFSDPPLSPLSPLSESPRIGSEISADKLSATFSAPCPPSETPIRTEKRSDLPRGRNQKRIGSPLQLKSHVPCVTAGHVTLLRLPPANLSRQNAAGILTMKIPATGAAPNPCDGTKKPETPSSSSSSFVISFGFVV